MTRLAVFTIYSLYSLEKLQIKQWWSQYEVLREECRLVLCSGLN